MKRILFLVLFLQWLSFFGQEKKFEAPDYKKIQTAIKEQKSQLHYAKLMAKFNASDYTMTLEEKRHLYYGYTFQENYSPYSHSIYSDSLRLVLKKETISTEDQEKTIRLSDLILSENPFDLRTINYKLYCLKLLNRKDEFKKSIIKMNIIMDALMSSGDGVTKKTAIYVINTSNEYDLLNLIGFEFGGEQSLIEHYDYLKLAKNKYNIDGLYFDVSPCLNHLSKKFK